MERAERERRAETEAKESEGEASRGQGRASTAPDAGRDTHAHDTLEHT
jgi:hypothetical protein